MFLTNNQKARIIKSILEIRSDDNYIANHVLENPLFIETKIRKEKREDIRLGTCRDFHEPVLNIDSFCVLINAEDLQTIKRNAKIEKGIKRRVSAIFIYPGNYEKARKFIPYGHRLVCNGEFVIKTWSDNFTDLEIIRIVNKNKLGLE